MNMISKLYKIFQKTIDILLFLLLTVTVISISVQVFTRFVLFYSVSWTEELARYCFIYMVFLGACVGVRDGKQIVLDVIDNFLKGEKAKKTLEIFQYGTQIVAVCLLMWSSIAFLPFGLRQNSIALPILMSTIYICLPIGYGLILLESVIKVVQWKSSL